MTASSPLSNAAEETLETVNEGTLCCRQSLEATLPHLSDAEWERLPERMIALHFKWVRRSSLGTMSLKETAEGLDVRLLGRFTALSFRDETRHLTPEAILLRWNVGPGFLARPGQPHNGSLILAADRTSLPSGDDELHFWTSVQGYPSRFLPLAGKRPLRPLLVLFGKLYSAYHEAVSFHYLRSLVRSLHKRKVASQ